MIRTSTLIHNRHGYTLLELLLALALSTVLLLSVTSMLYGYYQVRDAGERQIDEARIRYALNHQLRADLDWGTSNPSMDDGDLFEGGGMGWDSQVGERVLRTDFGFSLDSAHFSGRSDYLVMSRLAPRREAGGSSRQSARLEVRAIAWIIGDRESIEVPFIDGTGEVEYAHCSLPRDRVPNGDYGMTMKPGGTSIRRVVFCPEDAPRFDSVSVYSIEGESIGFRYRRSQAWIAQWMPKRSLAYPDALEINGKCDASNPFDRIVIDLVGGLE